VDNATLNRFFSLHYLLPFILAAFAVLHLIALHQNGSNNPLGVSSNSDRITFHPYYNFKDLVGFNIFFTILIIIVFFYPNLLSHPDNYIQANPLVTPTHIQPE
jgi:ubiquinol-cytochrome c reductase cytochrome b subunit